VPVGWRTAPGTRQRPLPARCGLPSDCPTVPGAGLGIGTALGPPILLRAEGSGPSHGGGDGGGAWGGRKEGAGIERGRTSSWLSFLLAVS
jgi:hypothetical protein